MARPNYDPNKVKRCYYCGGKVVLVSKKLTIFHKDYCKPAHNYNKETKTYEIEEFYPGIDHGGYVECFKL